MKKLFSFLMLWRSVPAFLAFLSLSEENKAKIRQDMVRYEKKPSPWSLHLLLTGNVTFRRVMCTRLLKEGYFKFLCARLFYRPLTGLEISADTNQIGGGLLVEHGYSTIILCHQMGENCTVYQNVTLGRGKNIDGINAPIIGNNVTIYTGAVVVGGIHIGDNVTIGAGAVVVRDVPPNTVVVGAKNRYIPKSIES